MIYLDDFKYFNKQIKYYASLLVCFSNEPNRYYDNTLCSLINTINLATLYISKFEQESSNTKQINEIFNELESLNDMECLSECDPKKQIRNCLSHACFRICIDEKLATPTLMSDGHYAIHLLEEGLYLELDNGKIRGKLSFKDFAKISLKYNEISTSEKILPRLALIPVKTTIRSSSNFDSVLDEIEYLKVNFFNNENLKEEDTEAIFEELMIFLKNNSSVSAESDLNNYRNFLNMRFKLYGENDYFVERSKITEEEKDFIKEYIKYLGIGVWDNNLNDNERMLILKDILELQNGKYCNFANTNWAQMALSRTSDIPQNEVKYLYCEKPFLYADTLLSYCNYCFNYTREVNQHKKKSNNTSFKFKDIDLSGINPSFNDPKEKKEKEVVLSDENLTKELEDKKEVLYNSIGDIVRKINNMNSNNKDPKKESKLQEINSNIENLKVDQIIHKISNKIIEKNGEEYSNLTVEIIEETIRRLMQGYDSLTEQEKTIINLFKETTEKYKNKSNDEYPIEELDDNLVEINENIIQNQTRYIDSSNFFRHMRNSLAHGKYSVDYSKALATKDFMNIKITFEDWEEKDGKEEKIFSVTIKAKRLLKLLDDYSRNINNQIEEELSSKEIEQFQSSVHQEGLYLEPLITDMPQGLSIEEKIAYVNKHIQDKKKRERRPTNEEFEEQVGEETLIDAIEGKNIGIEILDDGNKTNEVK